MPCIDDFHVSFTGIAEVLDRLNYILYIYIHLRSFEYDPVGKVTYIWVNFITTETCDLTGIMVSIGNHPQMA